MQFTKEISTQKLNGAAWCGEKTLCKVFDPQTAILEVEGMPVFITVQSLQEPTPQLSFSWVVLYLAVCSFCVYKEVNQLVLHYHLYLGLLQGNSNRSGDI